MKQLRSILLLSVALWAMTANAVIYQGTHDFAASNALVRVAPATSAASPVRLDQIGVTNIAGPGITVNGSQATFSTNGWSFGVENALTGATGPGISVAGAFITLSTNGWEFVTRTVTNGLQPAGSYLVSETDPVFVATSNLFYRASNPSGYVTAAITNGLAATAITNGLATAIVTNGLATTTSLLATAATLQAGINAKASPSITNGFVTATVTNGLAAPSITNGLARTTITNGLLAAEADPVFVAASGTFYKVTNPDGYVTATVTNGLATTGQLTDFVTASVTNGLASTEQLAGLVTASVTNGLLATESDPVFVSASNLFLLSSTAAATYQPLGSYASTSITNGLLRIASGPGISVSGDTLTLSTNGWVLGGGTTSESDPVFVSASNQFLLASVAASAYQPAGSYLSSSYVPTDTVARATADVAVATNVVQAAAITSALNFNTSQRATNTSLQTQIDGKVGASVTNGLLGSATGPGISVASGKLTLSTNGWSFGSSGVDFTSFTSGAGITQAVIASKINTALNVTNSFAAATNGYVGAEIDPVWTAVSNGINVSIINLQTSVTNLQDSVTDLQASVTNKQDGSTALTKLSTNDGSSLTNLSVRSAYLTLVNTNAQTLTVNADNIIKYSHVHESANTNGIFVSVPSTGVVTGLVAGVYQFAAFPLTTATAGAAGNLYSGYVYTNGVAARLGSGARATGSALPGRAGFGGIYLYAPANTAFTFLLKVPSGPTAASNSAAAPEEATWFQIRYIGP